MHQQRLGYRALLVILVGGATISAALLLAGVMRSGAASVSGPSGRIVFVRTATDPNQDDDLGNIYVMNADGTHQRNLTHSLAYYDPPVWAPDRRRIAFAAQKRLPGRHEKWATNIYVINADGTGFRQLTRTAWNDDPVWSPDSRRIAFVRHGDPTKSLGSTWSEIYVVSAGGGNQRRLTRNRFSESALGWSSQDRLVFVRSPRHDPQHWSGREIITMKPDGSDKRFLTHNRQAEDAPVWSPDGSKLLFVRWRSRDYEHGSLLVMDADGGNQRQLTPKSHPYDGTNAPDVRPPSWSPDGSMIAYPSPVRYDTHIYVMAAGASGLHSIAAHDAQSFAWSPDSRTLAFTRYPAIWLVNADGRGERRLVPRPGRPEFALHKNWLADWAPDAG